MKELTLTVCGNFGLFDYELNIAFLDTAVDVKKGNKITKGETYSFINTIYFPSQKCFGSGSVWIRFISASRIRVAKNQPKSQENHKYFSKI